MKSITPKQARQLAGLTQHQVAVKMGISDPTYGKLESDPDRFTLRQAKIFCKIVQQPLELVFFYPVL